MARILGNRQGHYVNVHTTDFPGGAVRGQLFGTSQSVFGARKTVELTGAAECNAAGVCNLGDPDGAGTAAIRLIRQTSYVCYRIDVRNILLPAVATHIHRGSRTSAGGIVVNMTRRTQPGSRAAARRRRSP